MAQKPLVLKDGQVQQGEIDIAAVTGLAAALMQGGGGFIDVFIKADRSSPVFVKTGAGTAQVKAGTKVEVFGTLIEFASATAITMPTLAAGSDYEVWVKDDSSIAAFPISSPPSSGNWRLIGGFHYGLVGPSETVAGGSFATTGTGMIWTQGDVDKIKGINEFSIWDLKWRPAYSSPRGMSLCGQTWWDIYYCGTNHITDGTSKNNTNIASGTVLPKKPLEFGGNGTTTYSALDWYVANEIARSHGKRLPWLSEFVQAAFGVTENQSIGGASSTYPNTGRNAGYTSKYGIEQATGHHWIWLLDSSHRWDSPGAWDWRDQTGGRGQTYIQGDYGNVRAIAGGNRGSDAYSGSRASVWNSPPWDSGWPIGLRCACDHLSLA